MSIKAKITHLTTLGLLTALITISGALKLPGLLPGSEFQLSAPIAVAVCAIFGIKYYLISGILSSLIGLMLGTQHIFNVGIALIFRLVVVVCFLFTGKSKFFYLLAGPLATLIARLVISLFLGKAAIPLILAALPGMFYTSVTSKLIAKILERVSIPRPFLES